MMQSAHTVPFSPTMIHLHESHAIVPVSDIYYMVPGEFVDGLDASSRAKSIKIVLKTTGVFKTPETGSYSHFTSINTYNDRAERDAVLLMYTGIF